MVKLQELYESIPQPHYTQHTWRYSDYSFFVKDLPFDTKLEVLSENLTILEGDLFESLAYKFPEKITLYNLLNFKRAFSVNIKNSGVYKLDQKFLGTYNITRSQFKIEPGLSVDLIITSSDENRESTTNNVMEFFVDKGGKLNVFFDNYFSNSYTHNFVYLKLSDSSDVRFLFSTFNPKYEKSHIKALIDGENSNFIIYILAKVDNLEHVDYRTENIHLKSNSKSLSVYRSIADGRSRSIYTGMLRVEKDAFYCDAYQNSRNILLSDKARIETIPELEILNQNVRCTHGAVVSSIDNDAVYYFMSRGISQEEAIKLITDGFLLDNLEDTFGSNIFPACFKKVTNEEFSYE